MKKILLLFGLVAMFACNDETIPPKKTEVAKPVTKDDYYYNNYGEKIMLEIDSTMWYVVLPKETYDKIEAERTMRGEESAAQTMFIEDSFFREELLATEVKNYVGCVRTFIKRNELSATDSCIYKGVVYKQDDQYFNYIANYNAHEFKIWVILHNEEDIAVLRDVAEQYKLTIYEKVDWFAPAYALLYTNGYYGMSISSIINYLYESELFKKIYSFYVADYITET